VEPRPKIIIIIIIVIMGHECEGRRVWGKSVRKGEKERILRGEEN
jgi:hypothetical protein